MKPVVLLDGACVEMSFCFFKRGGAEQVQS